MELASLHGLVQKISFYKRMKDNIKMAWSMEKDNIDGAMVESIKENGIKDK